MPQMPKSFIADDDNEIKLPKSFIADDEIEAPKKGLIDKSFDFAKNILANPKVREISERMLTGTSPEYQSLLKERGIPQTVTSENEASLLPEWKSQPETFAGGFTKSIYNDIIRPFVTPSGFVGSAQNIIPEIKAPIARKMLPSGPRFYGGGKGIIDVASVTDRPSVLPRSREVSYKSPESLNLSESTEVANRALGIKKSNNALSYRNEYEPWRGARIIREKFAPENSSSVDIDLSRPIKEVIPKEETELIASRPSEKELSLTKTSPEIDAPRLAGVQNTNNGILYLQFDRAGKPVSVKDIQSMFPGKNISVSKFGENILSPHLQKFRLDVFDENGRISSKAAKVLEDELGGSFHDWQRAGEEAVDKGLIKNKPPDLPASFKADELPEDTIEMSGGLWSPGGLGGGGKRLPPREGPLGPTIDKLMASIQAGKGLATKQEQLLRVERAKRFSAFGNASGEGEEWARNAMSKLKGEYPKINRSPIQLDDAERKQLLDAVKRANITNPEKARAITALDKMVNGGATLQRNELALLNEIYGQGFADQIIDMHGGINAAGIKLAKTANTMKAMSSAVDMSAPLRQGAGLIHRKEWRDSSKEMFKYLADKEYFNSAMQALENKPNYLLGRESGLFLSKPGTFAQSEEAFMNNYVPNLPGIRDVVGASERAYTGFLNKLRSDTFDSMLKQAEGLGHKPFTVVEHFDKTGNEVALKRMYAQAKSLKINTRKASKELTDIAREHGLIYTTKVPTDSTRAIARYINYATGRGGLGALEKIASELNTVLWSPRLITSRLGLLTNPKLFMDLPKGMRLETLKSLVGIAALGATTGTLGALAGGKVLGHPLDDRDMKWFTSPKRGERIMGANSNILSADFGKLRFGNKTLDPYAGFQQPIVAMARMLAGRTDQRKQSAPETAWNFTTNKFSPMASLAYDLATAQDFTSPGLTGNPAETGYTDRFGQKKNISKEIALRFAPMLLQDLTDLATTDPGFAEATGLNTALGIAAGFGMGSQTYEERKNNLRRPSIRRITP